MNEFQVFGFIVLPVVIAAAGWIIALVVVPPKRHPAAEPKTADLFDERHA